MNHASQTFSKLNVMINIIQNIEPKVAHVSPVFQRAIFPVIFFSNWGKLCKDDKKN